MKFFLYLLITFCSVLIAGGRRECSCGQGPEDLVMSGTGTMNIKYMWDQVGSQIHVPVVIDEKYSPKQRSIILNGLDEIQSKTCIDFIFYNSNYSLHGRDHVYITGSKKGCWSYVGRVGGAQELSLGTGCINHRTAVHEMMHALGFTHEHVRSDRDQYVHILWDNIQRGRENNFKKRRGSRDSGSPFGPYDYKSIMHYEKSAFSINNEDTIRPLKEGVGIGVYRTMSYWDVVKLNRMYNCEGAYSPEFSSPNSNYLQPAAPDFEDFDDKDEFVTPTVPQSAPRRLNFYDYHY